MLPQEMLELAAAMVEGGVTTAQGWLFPGRKSCSR